MSACFSAIRRARHAAGEVVDLDSVEVGERHLDRALLLRLLERDLGLPSALQLHEDRVLQPAQAHVGLGEEVARPARGVEEREPPQLVVVGAQGSGAGARVLLREDVVEFFLQPV